MHIDRVKCGYDLDVFIDMHSKVLERRSSNYLKRCKEKVRGLMWPPLQVFCKHVPSWKLLKRENRITCKLRKME
ncbi:hypothetical protein GOP47_0027354 [Adiantum capillus-veneris]|nr:hypothetical protein GOP47_0027354 [Adiantum capillus-veneris]